MRALVSVLWVIAPLTPALANDAQPVPPEGDNAIPVACCADCRCSATVGTRTAPVREEVQEVQPPPPMATREQAAAEWKSLRNPSAAEIQTFLDEYGEHAPEAATNALRTAQAKEKREASEREAEERRESIRAAERERAEATRTANYDGLRWGMTRAEVRRTLKRAGFVLDGVGSATDRDLFSQGYMRDKLQISYTFAGVLVGVDLYSKKSGAALLAKYRRLYGPEKSQDPVHGAVWRIGNTLVALHRAGDYMVVSWGEVGDD